MEKISNYTAFSEYIIRTPLLPVNEVLQLTIDKIKELCNISYVSEAIYIASPELHVEMIKFISGKTIKDENRLIITLLKYLLRMGNRATPFGLFSGCSVGQFDTENNIELSHPLEHKRFTRLDMNYLCALSQKLDTDKEIRNSLKYYPNTSIYKVGNKLRYIEFKYEKTVRRHFTISIDHSEYISILLDHCQDGATITELANLINEPDVTEEEAFEFIHELIDNQILISSLSPYVTGEDYFDYLKNALTDKKHKDIFSEVDGVLNKINTSPIGKGFEYYGQLYEAIKKFDVIFNKKFLLQTDMITTFKNNTLDKSLTDRINSALVALNKLSVYEENEDFIKFKEAFYLKYEDEEIPLSIALDIEAGIGYPTGNSEKYDIFPLVDDIAMAKAGSYKNYSEIKWRTRDIFLHKKMLEAIKNNESELIITDNDLKGYKGNWDNLPDTFSVFIKILSKDKKPSVFIDYVGNTTAASVLSRFSHSDGEIKKFVDKIIKAEDILSDNVYAEVVHLPESRTGNILFRPHLRDYEIAFLSKSNIATNKQIPIDDIMVSIKSEKIVLRSKKLNKIIIPKLTTAHDYTGSSLPMYRFLGDLQTQDINESIVFSWGNLYALYNFFPRVVYKDIILSPAFWIMQQSTINIINTKTKIELWREKSKIPSKVLFADGDNRLLIDFEHDLSVEMFISLIKNKTELTLIEYLFDVESSIVNSDNRMFSNEIILSYYKTKSN